MKHKTLLSIAVTCLGITLFSNCHKKENTSPTTETAPQNTTPTCFNNLYSGTYIGSGFLMTTPFTSGTLTLTKTDCQTVSFDLYTNNGGGTNIQATQLTLNSNSNYDGKQSNGNAVTIIPGGNNIQINAISSFTFNGTKH